MNLVDLTINTGHHLRGTHDYHAIPHAPSEMKRHFISRWCWCYPEVERVATDPASEEPELVVIWRHKQLQ